jgi:hypothetical protein
MGSGICVTRGMIEKSSETLGAVRGAPKAHRFLPVIVEADDARWGRTNSKPGDRLSNSRVTTLTPENMRATRPKTPGVGPVVSRQTSGTGNRWRCKSFSRACGNRDERTMSTRTILIVVILFLLLGALPTWPYSGGWGYYPSGGLGLVLLIVVIVALLGRR